MKLKLFDVVELKDRNKATILGEIANGYKVEIVNKDGISQGIKEIEEINIKRIIFSK